jgi:hypothetical protein
MPSRTVIKTHEMSVTIFAFTDFSAPPVCKMKQIISPQMETTVNQPMRIKGKLGVPRHVYQTTEQYVDGSGEDYRLGKDEYDLDYVWVFGGYVSVREDSSSKTQKTTIRAAWSVAMYAR